MGGNTGREGALLQPLPPAPLLPRVPKPAASKVGSSHFAAFDRVGTPFRVLLVVMARLPRDAGARRLFGRSLLRHWYVHPPLARP